ncbi:alpha-L-fucosidase [Pedobacter glucosidilyticus]|uniref:alpha-L-fucosidase n=1 Tax=Pedobacter glucosidilyticus TaxID=1122941 RepID=UPI0026EF9164|nr:alpha-L-fucosidase [Pedobacter glucosidilyticus]
MKIKFACLVLSLFITTTGIAQKKYEPTWESIDSRPVPQWFQDAKFGIFIHWGVYSVPSYIYINREGSVYDCYAEWYEILAMSRKGPSRDFHDKMYGKNFGYRQFAPMFKAELWNPDKWATLFKDAGAKYVILTSKHHDGYTLWPSTSPYSKGWNALEVGPKRDLVGDLTNAVRAKGLKMGLYYSLMEWESTPTDRPGNFNGYYLPDSIISKYKIPADKMISEHIVPQMKELVMKYQPAIIYPDGDWDEDYKRLQSLEFLSWLYNNAPNKDEVAVNDRWGKVRGEHGGYYSREYADTDDVSNDHPWEEIQGMGYSFGYNRNEDIHDYRSSEELIHLLVNTVGRGGNLCLNVGPTADGRIPVIMEQRLLDIGEWLKINGEGIYGTQAWHNPAEVKPAPAKVASTEEKKEKSAAEAAATSTNKEVFYTYKGNDLYILTTKLPESHLHVEGLTLPKGLKIELLGADVLPKYKSKNGKLSIELPKVAPNAIKSKYAYVLKITGGAEGLLSK